MVKSGKGIYKIQLIKKQEKSRNRSDFGIFYTDI